MDAIEITALARWMQKVTDQTQEEGLAFEGEISGCTSGGKDFVLTFSGDDIELEVRT